MKLYFQTDYSDYPHLIRCGVKNTLYSYADMLTPNSRNRSLLQIERGGFNAFLDSGAFGAWNSGIEVTLGKYIAFVQQFGKYFAHIACLDVLFDPEQSMDNYKDMVRMGIKNVLPVWHQSEPFEYLEKYCDMTDYVCI